MFRHLVVLVITSITLVYPVEPATLHLMPVPFNIQQKEGLLRIDGGFAVAIHGNPDPRIAGAVSRMLERLERKTGIPFSSPVNPKLQQKPAVMEIDCRGGEEAADESYHLEVSGQRAVLSAPAPTGVLRGLETFLQLVDINESSFFVPAVEIVDRPRFEWRGLHNDVSRHWQPVDVILRNLDAMAAVKMNVFHWHLSDDQGFRVESRRFPLLHQKGSDGNFYTQAQIREVVAYAHERGIRVIPEFDMPGHTTAWFVGHPELASAPGPYQIERSWGVFDPCMDPSKESVYRFLNAFIGEMTALFPDPYFHVGGDEVTGRHWNASAGIKAFKEKHRLKSNRDLQAYFNRRLQKILESHGKKMIGWNEILHPDLPRDVIVQSWLGQNSLVEAAKSGFRAILSRGYYLDHMRPASFHYETDPWGKETGSLTAEQRKKIIGAEACMWAEFVSHENIESRIWPRAAAIAERLWSPPHVKDVQDMYRRLDRISIDLDRLGIRHLNNKRAMLQRMIGDESVVLIERLADQFVPTNLAVRQKIQKYYSYTPLNRMVDTVSPESNAARALETFADTLASSHDSTEALSGCREILGAWRRDEEEISAMIERSFLLREVGPLYRTVIQLNSRGLEALQYLASKTKPPEAWQREISQLIKDAEKPQAEMLPAMLSAVRKLFQTASAIP